ncbi:uncharacterized protein LOC144139488 isoform X1 [Haemaphysalis longicornis]
MQHKACLRKAHFLQRHDFFGQVLATHEDRWTIVCFLQVPESPGSKPSVQKKEKQSSSNPDEKKQCKNISRNLSRTKKRLANAVIQVAHMKEQNEALSEEAFDNKIKSLPSKQQLAVKSCFLAARRKSHKGMRYDDEWILECMLMRMRSPKLYKHLRREAIMVLPERTCLQKYLQRFKGGFGLSANIFNALHEKTKTMDFYSRHGGLLIDEIKLSEHLTVKSAGDIEGFVDLGDHTPADQKNVLADHGMIMLLQPFIGNWTQILGVFASKGNVKAPTLARIILETTVLAEKAGLFVDSITCDGAN